MAYALLRAPFIGAMKWEPAKHNNNKQYYGGNHWEGREYNGEMLRVIITLSALRSKIHTHKILQGNGRRLYFCELKNQIKEGE